MPKPANSTSDPIPPLETFTIADGGGYVWTAVRQPLGVGTYRTPDDPTSLQDLIDARIDAKREQDIQELIANEFGQTWGRV